MNAKLRRNKGLGRLRRMALLVLAVLSGLKSDAADWQGWLMQSVRVPIAAGERHGELSASVDQEERFGDGRYFDSETLALLGWRICPYLQVAIGHRLICERAAGAGEFARENQPTFEFTLSAPEFWTLRLDFRSRFEIRMKEGADAHLRYRSRLRLRTGWSVGRIGLSPYVSEEMFFSDAAHNASGDVFDQSRAVSGLSFRPITSYERLSCNVYYMVRHDLTAGGWRPTNAVGFEVAVTF